MTAIQTRFTAHRTSGIPYKEKEHVGDPLPGHTIARLKDAFMETGAVPGRFRTFIESAVRRIWTPAASLK
jgi:hypothetical protein